MYSISQMTFKVISNDSIIYPESKLESSNKQNSGGGWRRLDHDNYHKADTVAGQSPLNIIYPMQSQPFGDVYPIPSLLNYPLVPQKGPSLAAVFVLCKPTPVVTVDGTRCGHWPKEAFKILSSRKTELGLENSSQSMQ